MRPSCQHEGVAAGAVEVTLHAGSFRVRGRGRWRLPVGHAPTRLRVSSGRGERGSDHGRPTVGGLAKAIPRGAGGTTRVASCPDVGTLALVRLDSHGVAAGA